VHVVHGFFHISLNSYSLVISSPRSSKSNQFLFLFLTHIWHVTHEAYVETKSAIKVICYRIELISSCISQRSTNEEDLSILSILSQSKYLAGFWEYFGSRNPYPPLLYSCTEIDYIYFTVSASNLVLKKYTVSMISLVLHHRTRYIYWHPSTGKNWDFLLIQVLV